MSSSEAAVRHRPEKSRYEVIVGDEPAGLATYQQRPGLIAYLHTEIDPSHEGQGLAGQLIKAALDDAREQALDVLPFCDFVKGYLGKHAEYVDLVPERYRAAFDL